LHDRVRAIAEVAVAGGRAEYVQRNYRNAASFQKA